MTAHPRFMIADPAPAVADDFPSEYVVCLDPLSVWAFDLDTGRGSVIAGMGNLSAENAAETAREVGDWLANESHE